MKKVFLLLFVLNIVFFAEFGYIIPGNAESSPIVKWDLPHFIPPNHFIAKDLYQFTEGLEAKTNGKFKIVYHPGSSLLKGPQTAPALVAGRVPIAPILTPYVYDLFPKLGVTYLPFLTSSYQELRVSAEKLRSYFYKVLGEKNLKPLFTYAWTTQQLFSNKPMATVAAWKGKKVRIFNEQQADLCKRVKAVPINIAASEIYTAMQRGTMDSLITANINIVPMKLYEVSKYANQWTINGGGLEFMCVNMDAYNKLPQEYQKALLEFVEESGIGYKIWDHCAKADENSINELKSMGMTILYPSKAEIEKMRNISRPIWDKWAKKNGTEDLLKKMLEAVGP
jgi:TRAP-type C4-dicarboxylate transport system substrate-binding protein